MQQELTLPLRRSNFYISTHSHSRKCVENFPRCAQREREIVDRISRGNTRERRERVASSKMTVPRQTNTQKYTYMETHILVYERRIYSERSRTTLWSRARRKPRRRSEINYGISGGRPRSGNVPQRLQHLVRGLTRLCVANYRTAVLATGLSYLSTCDRRRTNCERNRTFGIRSAWLRSTV